MCSDPMISVIVPVYHVEKYLKKCLDSILDQTFSDFELILINDGGNEEETAICEEYAGKDSRIRYVFQANQGLSAARNSGLRIHRGKWIMFVDSDDWVDREFCARALESVSSAGADICIFDLIYKPWEDHEGNVHRSFPAEGVYSSYEILSERIRGRIQCYAWNKIYRETIWDDIVFPVGEIWEDDAVLHEVIDKADKISIIHDVLYYKRLREGTITGEAIQTRSNAYWLYVQRRRRFEYLAEHYPELVPVATDNMVSTVVDYGAVCLFYTKDKKGWTEARRWAKNARMSLESVRWFNRIRYHAFLHCKPFFFILEKTVPHLKKLRKRVIENRGMSSERD